MFKSLTNAIEKKYNFNKGDVSYQLSDNKENGYLYVSDIHALTINYKPTHIDSIKITTYFETPRIKRTINKVLRAFTKHQITTNNHVWCWDNESDCQVTVSNNQIFTNASFEHWKNSESGRRWRLMMENRKNYDGISV
jgi:hypothetical protein